jgi:uracil permease
MEEWKSRAIIAPRATALEKGRTAQKREKSKGAAQMNENNSQGIFNARKELGIPKTLLLGVQHMFAMFGATILVPILVAGYFGLEEVPIQVTLFFAGVGTLFFHFCTKWKVPAFLGSSFAYLGGFAGVAALTSGDYATMDPTTKLSYACGGIVVAGLLYLVLAALVKAVGVKQIMRFLPPVVTGPIIILIGLSLAPSAVSNASTNWLLAGVALVIIIVCNVWGKGMIKILPILLGVLGSYAVALAMQFGFGMTNPDGSAILDFSSAAAYASQGISGFIHWPKFVLARFDLTAVLVMAPVALASMMEHIGDISSISATVGENFIEDPGLQRTLIGDGIATALAGLCGGPANTTYGENTGVLALSKVYDPLVIRLAAVFAVILSFCPVVAQIIGSIPSSIIGGVSFVLYGMISAIGVRNMVENHVDLTNSRNLIVAALILVTGLGFSDGLTFELFGTPITLTALALAAIVGIVANAVLPGKDYEFGTK